MNTKYFGLLTGSMWALLALGVVPGAYASEKPSTDFLVAALKHQEASCGMSLQVTYTTDRLGTRKAGNLHYEARYVRTPTTLFKEIKKGSLKSDAPGDYDWCCGKTRYSFDRTLKVCREITTPVTGDTWMTGTLTNLPWPIRMGEIMDPVLFRLAQTNLIEALANGIVKDIQEVIDGQQCWRVDVPGAKAGAGALYKSFSVWLDPEIGFSPRRATISSGEAPGSDSIRYEFTDYKALPNEVFFPMQITTEYGSESRAGLVMKAQEVTCGQGASAEDISVVFPSGMKVRVLPDGVQATIP